MSRQASELSSVSDQRTAMAAKYITVILGIVAAGVQCVPIEHGVAYSSQSIVSHAAPIIAHAPIAIHATPLIQAAPVAKVAIAHKVEEIDAHPSYKFEYGVNDAHTGDIKSQSEEREGDVVKGQYSLIEPDGSKRTVEYTADDHNGFNAVVHREQNAHPQVVHKVEAAPLIHAAPLITTYHH